MFLDESSYELILMNTTELRRVKIQPILVKLLMVLTNNKETTISREHIISEVWDDNYGVGEKALTKNIYKIRQILKKNGFSNVIETVPTKGYRLNVSPKYPRKQNRYRNMAVVAGILILALLITQIMFPGLFHYVTHRLGY